MPGLTSVDSKLTALLQDTLIHRTQVLEDAQTASKNAIHKRRAVEKLRGNTRIDPSKVDDAIEEMREVGRVRV